jgi:hypothetical protein
LTERHHLAQRVSARVLRVGFAPTLFIVLIAGLSGCGHKKLRSVLPHGVLAPVELETAPTPDAEVAAVPTPELGPLPGPPPAPRPTPKKKPAPKEEAQSPVQVASDAGPATLAIGALSTGGDATPESQQQTRDLIGSILKRIAALPAKLADGQKKQIRQVRNFLDQAQQALNTGDTAGANNLATKARLLMDDLDKR